MASPLAYRRVLLKLSGEALGGEAGVGLDPETLDYVSKEIGQAQETGAQIAIVVGGGNFLRGATMSAAGFDRVAGDGMGMLATVLNALALAETFRQAGIDALALSAIEVRSIVEPYHRGRALSFLESGGVVVLAGGTGNPYFSTDTAAALRAAELGADGLFKATKVDGVYDRDPVLDPSAHRFESLTYQEVLDKGLGVMDLTAVTLCKENAIPVVVFDVKATQALQCALEGGEIGTTISAATSGEDGR